MSPESMEATSPTPAEPWEALQAQIVSCQRCPRLVAWRQQVAQTKRRAYLDWDYWGKPVSSFGDPQARILVVGLAPAAHGANRTGRMFTGDSSGNFLYPALYQAGFANQPDSERRGDGLRLTDILISAAVRCAPPDNKPSRQEIENCRPYLVQEMALLSNLEGIVALGKIGFDNVLDIYRGLGYPIPRLAFGHAAFYRLGAGLPWLLASYHPSRQNTQTGRLTPAMFARVWRMVRTLLENGDENPATADTEF